MLENFRLQDECQLLQDVSEYSIPNEHDIRTMDAHSISALFEGEYNAVIVQKSV